MPTVGRLNPWEQLQTLTLLDGTEGGALSDDPTVDALRHAAVWLTHMLVRARDGFARHCSVALRRARELRSAATPTQYLTVWLDAALRAVQETRLKLTVPLESDSADIVRERPLIDEFASVRVLETLGDATTAAASLDALRGGVRASPRAHRRGSPRRIRVSQEEGLPRCRCVVSAVARALRHPGGQIEEALRRGALSRSRELSAR